MRNSRNILPGDYIAGFVDGEGCFALNYSKETRLQRKGTPSYYRWTSYFYIVARYDDREILEQIKDALNCGKIYILNKEGIREGTATVQYAVQNFNDIFNKIIPFFHKYPLRAKKKYDFELWEKGVKILSKHKKKPPEGKGRGWTLRPYSNKEHNALLLLRNKMRRYKSTMKRDYKYIHQQNGGVVKK
ncbi:LAGLIDADG family homing endonuclease [Patescibacteria group bacterium AH-259-L05]|nr:LAGLIDADG family homing endonuclease [Patescibacteria group bacterium AH-259-L05]